jgi:putative PEP-CTERM system TPR-repeat lipoprotein
MMLGLVNMQQGNLGQAEMHLANVVARNPDNVRAQQLLISVRGQMQSPEQTLESLKPALDRPQVDPSLFALAGQLSMQSGNREEALGYLARAAQSSSPATPEAQLELASGYLAAGELDQAVAVLEAMPSSEGTPGIQRETLLVAALLRQGKTSEAIVRADTLAARPPADTASHGFAGAIYAAAGQPDRARAEWERVLEVKPDDVSARINLARVDIAQGKADRAKDQFEKILAKDPTNLMATVGLAAVAQSQKDTDAAGRWIEKAVADHPDSADVRLTQSRLYLEQRDFGKAKAAATEALRLSPKSAAAANTKGVAELGAGDLVAAIGSFQQAVEFAPKGGYHANLARALLMDRKPDEAIRTLDEALKISPAETVTLALAATMALQTGQLEKATGYVARLRAAAPEAASTMRLEGDLAMANKRYGNALEYYGKAAAAGSDGTLAIARYRAGMASGAKQPQKPLEDWLIRAPGDAAVRVVLAEYHQQRGDESAAVAGYEKALETAPGNIAALNNLAGIYQAKGDERALPLAKRAYEAAPGNAAVQDTYGWSLVESGELDRGLKLIREASKSLKGVPEVQYHLGVALARKGETDEARRILKQVLATNAPASVRDGAEAELAKLSQ